MRRYPDRIEPDPSGHPMRRGELIWLAPSQQAQQSALAQGFTVLREQDLPENTKEFQLSGQCRKDMLATSSSHRDRYC